MTDLQVSRDCKLSHFFTKAFEVFLFFLRNLGFDEGVTQVLESFFKAFFLQEVCSKCTIVMTFIGALCANSMY